MFQNNKHASIFNKKDLTNHHINFVTFYLYWKISKNDNNGEEES
jgi:hypothetical protein